MSRLRSSRGSKSGPSRSKAAATPRQRGVLVQAPKSDIYVALLGVALAVLIIASVLMAILLGQYGWSTQVS